MKGWSKHPLVYEINTWAWLNELAAGADRPLTLADIPGEELRRLAEYRFDAIWLMGVWKRSPGGREIARSLPDLQAAYRAVLPDYRDEDIAGSPYSVLRYEVDPALGGSAALAALRRRMRALGIRLILDFVPNHLAADHEWIEAHPERFVQATPGQLEAEPENYFTRPADGGHRIFAHGRDPNFKGWTDTVQLDYRRPDTRRAMSDLLLAVASQCDGVRCDMAMLTTADVFTRTWGGEFDPPQSEFWPDAIRRVKAEHPDFLLLAEVYWDLEYKLQQLGFDFTYDKRLYDRLKNNDATAVRAHLRASFGYQRRLARFVENHDELRAVQAFGAAASRAAATLVLTLPGLRLVHEGQMDGRRLKLPVQLSRRPVEPPDAAMRAHYARLLGALADPVFDEGHWQLLEPQPISRNSTAHLHIVAFHWTSVAQRRVVVVNWSAQRAECRLPLDLPELAGSSWQLVDLLKDDVFVRQGDEMLNPGLWIDLPPHGAHLFELRAQVKPTSSALKHRCTFRGHKRAIYAVAWSPDGSTLASAGEERTICLWSPEHCAALRTLPGESDVIAALAWSADGHWLATGSDDRHVRLVNVASGTIHKVLRGHGDHVLTVAWSPLADAPPTLASGSIDRRVILWSLNGDRLHTFAEHADAVNAVAWSPDGRTLASGSGDRTVRLWDVAARSRKHLLKGHDWVSALAWAPDGRLLVAATGGGTVEIWDPDSGKQVRVRQGHTQRLVSVAFSADGRLLFSKAADGTVRVWRTDTWDELAVLQEAAEYLGGLAAHPSEPLIATRDDKTNNVRVWEVAVDRLLGAPPPERSVNYTNAKVVLIGQESSGKSCVARALVGEEFVPQESTHAMTIYPFRTELVARPDEGDTTRETFLWDLAGQRDYQIIHQLFLDEAALGIVVFNPAQIEDLFATVEYWETALRRVAGDNCPRLLVAGRVDRGRPAVTVDDIEAFCRDRGFAQYIPTSAKTGEGIDELRTAIGAAIRWSDLPVTSSSGLWKEIRRCLLERRTAGDVLVREAQLIGTIRRGAPDTSFTDAEFKSVLRHAEVQGLVRRLAFGDYVLLKPELLNAYASAIVRFARRNEQGIASLAERDVLDGRIDFEDMERIDDAGAERSLLHAVVALLLDKEVALLEGEFLVFPSKFSRRPPSREIPLEPAVAYRFTGPAEAIYATLVVRLFYGRAFEVKELWKDGVELLDPVGSVSAIRIEAVSGSGGQLTVSFDHRTSIESKVLLLKLVSEHLQRRALNGAFTRERYYRCAACGEAVENRRAVERRLAEGYRTVRCQYCETPIELIDTLEERFGDPAMVSRIVALNEKAQQHKAEAVGVTTAKAKDRAGEFDVFLAYHTVDEDLVEAVARALVQRGLNPWFAKWCLPPGVAFLTAMERALANIKAVAVFVGPGGVGPWEEVEIRAAIGRFVKDERPVIPVVFGDARLAPPLPLFLDQFKWVCFATGAEDRKALDDLIWGVTRTNPAAAVRSTTPEVAPAG